jgi:YD repeat-containing protein
VALPPVVSNAVHCPLSVGTLDNLGEVTAVSRYDGDTIPLTDSNDELVAYSTTSFDDQGRVYQTHTYSVTPGTGAVSTNALASETFYDHRGDEIAQSTPAGQWTKYAYDGADRQVEAYTTDGGVLSGAERTKGDANLYIAIPVAYSA